MNTWWDGEPRRDDLGVRGDEVVHRCPTMGTSVMPCCGRTPFEIPAFHRMTIVDEMVTCPDRVGG